ncbi:hypothetical protein FRACYDRAFT_236758 [Fragilariopsis cylindrus CCMP1102]|uniref:Uncharacterized protein n=1 Tax=Fragilariopsis cylindrus CCMP1102 TaxID=635003 RepID=A0A1E7FJX1_9STRA|nr:hypothetical protein FRACYDRAFT_236758 [Fragilariopsis cylindrus CCMP1102]|eukprot:OEU18480.1 hypothetical protein FRACYDRAFT_236758 [Fragilariopsis cylindrus CCMP1102]
MVRSSNTCPADVVVDKNDSLLHRNRILPGSDAISIEINRVRDNKRRNYQKKKNIAVSAIKALQCSSRATDDANNNNNNNNNNNRYVYDNFGYKKDDEEEKRRKKEQQQQKQKQKLDDSNDDNDGGAVRFGNFTANFELDNGSYDTLDKAFIWGKRAINPDEETNNTIVILSLGDTLSPTDGNDHYYYESNYDHDSPQIDRTARVQGIIDNATESDFANYDMTRTTTKTMNNHMLHDQQDCHVPNQRQQEQEKQVQLQIPELPTDEESRRLSSFYEEKNTLKKWRFKSPFDSDNNRSSNIHGPPPPPPPPDLTNFGMAISIPANNNKPSPSTSSEVDENIIDDTTSFITTSTTVSSFILPSNNNSSLSSDNNNNNNNHYKSISTAKYKYYLQQQKRNSSSNSNSNSGITRNNKVTAAIAPVTIRTPVLLGFFWKTHPLLTTVIDSDNDNYKNDDSSSNSSSNNGEQKETTRSSSIISMAEDDIFYRHQEESLANEEENESFDDDDDVDDGTEKVPNRKELSPYLHLSVVRKIWNDSQPFQLDAM